MESAAAAYFMFEFSGTVAMVEDKQELLSHVGGCQNPGLNDWPEPEGSEDLKERHKKDLG